MRRYAVTSVKYLLWEMLEMREWQRQWQSGNMITVHVTDKVMVTGG